MQLELTELERRELTNLVSAAHTDLGAEIHHARGNHYREILRQRRVVLDGLLKRLGAELKMAA